MVSIFWDSFSLAFDSGGNSVEVAGEKHPPNGRVVGALRKAIGVTKVGDKSMLSFGSHPKVRRTPSHRPRDLEGRERKGWKWKFREVSIWKSCLI